MPDTVYDLRRSDFEEHAIYEQLCALATSGALKAEEWGHLADHLKECADCREDIAKYQEIASFGVSLIAPNDASLDVENAWSPESAVAKLMRTLQEQEGVSRTQTREAITDFEKPHRHRSSWIPVPSYRPFLAYAAMLACITALSISLYVVGLRKGGQRVNIAGAQTGGAPDALLRQRGDLENELKVRSAETDRISRQLADATAVVEELRGDKLSADEKLNQLTLRIKDKEVENAALLSQYQAADQDRATLAEKLKESEDTLVAVQHSLQLARDQQSASIAEIAKLEDQIAFLNREGRPAEYLEARQLTSADPDLSSLMGARDLFIADVYDIDKTGSLRKPFGRVFYTRGKSLLFYAFDLDRQPGVKAASTFQVWGRRGYGDAHPINMGMMYLDNDASKRWVLKCNDAKALAQVDAVFVTIEPRGGSEVPKGRQLLYASLRTPPNHP